MRLPIPVTLGLCGGITLLYLLTQQSGKESAVVLSSNHSFVRQEYALLPQSAPEAVPPYTEDNLSSGIPTLTIPMLEIVRKQAQEDPHRTPTSMIEFARQVGIRFEYALLQKDIQVSARLFRELSECVTDTSLPSVQAFCLANAEKLASLHSEFAGDYRSLTASASPRTRELMRAAQALKGK